MAGGFKLLDAYVEVTADGSKAADEAAKQIESSPSGARAGLGFGKRMAVGIGAALVAAGIGAKIADAMDIQAGQAKLSAGLNLTKTQSAAAGKAAGSLYSSNYGESMSDVQDAVGSVVGSIQGMRGANATVVAGMTKDLLNLRSAYGIDVADSAASAGELLKTGMAKNGKEAADLLASGLSRVPPALRQDLLDSVNEYQPYFQQIGFTGSQMFDTLVAASKGGAIQLDKAGDAVKEFGIRVTDLTDTNAGPALKRLGLNQKSLADDMLKGGDRGKAAMEKIVSGLQGVKDPAEQAKLTAALFGTQIEDIGKGKIPGFLAGLNSTATANTKVAGSAAKLDKTLNATAQNSIASVRRGISGWTNDLIQNSGVLGAVVGVAGTVGPQMITAGAGIATMAGAMSNMGIVSKIAAAGQWLLNAAMSANPIGIIIIAIVALVAALVWFFTQTSVGRTILAGFFSWLRAVVGAIASWWSGVWAGIVAIFRAVWAGIVAFATAYVNTVRAVITNVVRFVVTFWRTYWNIISTVVRTVFTFIVNFVTAYINLVRTVITTGIRIVQTVWTSVLNTIRSVTTGIFNGIVGTIRGVIGTVISVVGAIPGKIRGFFAGAGTWLVDVGKSIINGLATGIRNAVGAVTGAVSGVLDTVKSFLPHSPAKRGPFSGSGWTAVGASGEAIVGEVGAGFNRAAKRTSLAMPKLKTAGALTGVGAAADRFGASSSSTTYGGDTIHATVQVNMDQIGDVSKLVDLFKALPQAARTGRSTTLAGV